MADPLLSIGMSGDSGAESRLKAFDATARMVSWADSSGPKLAAEIRREAPVSPNAGGGRLRDSIRYQRSTSIGGVTLKFHTNVPYAPYVVEGTIPHAIDARIALTLHFVGGDGAEHFPKHVWHPGTKANEFPQRALLKMLPEITSSFAEVFEEI